MSVSFQRNIYKHYNKYNICKTINGKPILYKSCNSLDEAIKYRDKLIANNWEPLPPTPEEESAKKISQYFKRINLNYRKNAYKIVNVKSKYLGTVKTIEEALYYRDLYSDCTCEVPRPKDVDLITDNPYLEEGLRYPIPKRLEKNKNESNYGKGAIVKKGPSSYHLHHSNKGNNGKSYLCACRTYEQAYYVRKCLQECDWDLSKLPTIFEEYPQWYTWLMKFYRYIGLNNKNHNNGSQYTLTVPKEYSETDSIERYYYGRLEDALFERDFLVEHNWDYELLVYTIDDDKNPYYTKELPPYPERKIRNIQFKNFDNELTEMRDYILAGVDNQEECAKLLGVTSPSIRNWLKKYNTSWMEFKEICLSGDDPLTLLEFQERIIQPDLSPTKPSNYKGYIHKGSERSPYKVVRKGQYYGSYKDKKTAKKVVNELKKVNWDKSYLKKIQEKVGYEKFIGSKKFVYKNSGGYSYSIRKKNKDRKIINFGCYKKKEVAELVRDLLVLCDWDINQYPIIRAMVEYCFNRNIIHKMKRM